MALLIAAPSRSHWIAVVVPSSHVPMVAVSV